MLNQGSLSRISNGSTNSGIEIFETQTPSSLHVLETPPFCKSSMARRLSSEPRYNQSMKGSAFSWNAGCSFIYVSSAVLIWLSTKWSDCLWPMLRRLITWAAIQNKKHPLNISESFCTYCITVQFVEICWTILRLGKGSPQYITVPFFSWLHPHVQRESLEEMYSVPCWRSTLRCLRTNTLIRKLEIIPPDFLNQKYILLYVKTFLLNKFGARKRYPPKALIDYCFFHGIPTSRENLERNLISCFGGGPC